jgi:hypothetical protein
MKTFPFELRLGQETNNPLMDLAIPMGQKDHSNEVMEMVKRHGKLYAQPNKLLDQAQKQYEKHANKT